MNLSKKELYELAWSKPMTTLAKEYGFSDGGFAKICRRNQIPIPPRGYWAKKAAGARVSKINLTLINENEMVYIETRKPISAEDILEKQTKLNQEKSEILGMGEIKVPNDISAPHKFTINTRIHFDKIIKKINTAKESKSLPKNYLDIIHLMHRGRIDCHQNNCFKLTVSENLVDRALIFLDTLTKELESRGFKIQSNRDDKFATAVIVIKDHEKINFQISEGYKYHPTDKRAKEMSPLEQLLYSDKEPVATGKLTFSVHTDESHIGRNWTDGKRLIEETLPAIIHEFTSLAQRQKQHRIDQEIIRKQRLIEFEIYREKEAESYRKQHIYNEAMKESQAFSEQMKLESYLKYLKDQIIEQHGELPAEASSWIETVIEVANKQNPINKRLHRLCPQKQNWYL